jgi:hypothetical protein
VLFSILAPTQLLLHYDAGIPDAIVVGIAYGSFDPPINKRGFDFSGPAADARSDQGGAPAFEMFLREELVPTIERRYRADQDRRILFGQSRGGYLGALVGVHRSGSFLGVHCQQSVFFSG